MKFLKVLLLVALLVVITAGFVVPATWLTTVNNLPTPIESAQDIEVALRTTLESERQSVEGIKAVKERQETDWPHPDVARLPKLVVQMYVVETGCPELLETPRETGTPWLKRLFFSAFGVIRDGDGACELIMARRIARQLGAKTPLQITAAADRVHQFLTREEIVAFDIESTAHERGIIGIEAASKKLLGKATKDLTVAETAELQLAVPPDGFWEDLAVCKNGSLIKAGRDSILLRMADNGVLTREAAKTATAQPIRCLQWKK